MSSIYRPKNGAPEMLRLLYLFAMAVLTVACAGISGPGRGLAVRNTPVELAVVTGANAALSASPPDSPLAAEWRESAARPAVFREAVEADVNDDDRDTRSELAEVPAVAFGSVWIPRKPRRAWRGEPQSDTSRFALRRGFPRGPPT